MRGAGALGNALKRPWSAGRNPLGLTELDVATGTVLGTVPTEPWGESGDDPLRALEGVARGLLAAGRRCVVAFSGGRDSSALLAVLLHVARRDGLPDPIAVTARWPGVAASDEREWQEHVATQLHLRYWEIVTPGTDLDLLGPMSRQLLRDHGLLWPAAFVALLPMIEVAGDGMLVSGEGGDEVFAHWPVARAWARVRHGRSLRKPVRALALAALPPPLRHRLVLRRAEPYQDWLRPEARLLQRKALAAEMGGPLLWPAHLRRVASERGLRMSGETFSSLCAKRGGSFARPLLAPAFLTGLARLGGPLGLGERTAAMTAVFGRRLSPEILSRSTKASFGDVFWGPDARVFATEWNGEGLDPGLVDADVLRATWRQRTPVYGSALPLQAAWLAQERFRQEAPVEATPQGRDAPAQNPISSLP